MTARRAEWAPAHTEAVRTRGFTWVLWDGDEEESYVRFGSVDIVPDPS